MGLFDSLFGGSKENSVARLSPVEEAAEKWKKHPLFLNIINSGFYESIRKQLEYDFDCYGNNVYVSFWVRPSKLECSYVGRANSAKVHSISFSDMGYADLNDLQRRALAKALYDTNTIKNMTKIESGRKYEVRVSCDVQDAYIKYSFVMASDMRMRVDI